MAAPGGNQGQSPGRELIDLVHPKNRNSGLGELRNILETVTAT